MGKQEGRRIRSSGRVGRSLRPWRLDRSVGRLRSSGQVGLAVALEAGGGLVVWATLGFGAGVADGADFSRFSFESGYEGPSRIASGAGAATVGAASSRGGDAFVAWAQAEPQPGTGDLWSRLWASRYARGAWELAQTLQAGPGPALYPRVAADAEGNAIVAWPRMRMRAKPQGSDPIRLKSIVVDVAVGWALITAGSLPAGWPCRG